MRISIILLFLLIAHVHAAPVFSQSAFNLSLRNVTVEQALDKIEKETNYRFLFTDKTVNVNRRVDVNLTTDNINEVMGALFNGTNVQYSIIDNQVILAGSSAARPGVTQTRNITGTVIDERGEPVIGANVVEKGTTNGVITNLDGEFTLSVAENAILQVSYIGYITQEVPVGGKTIFNIRLVEDTQKLDEVVVTALGIKRQSRSLGYSTAQVGGDQFTEARDMNLGNALSGKIAGVTVAGNATGSGGSSRVIIRGNASLTGNNQPLYVVDGVPFDNTNMGSSGRWGGMDLGDGLSNINPDDIADVQVLKGVAASALYGYRGGNGAILITTKSGKKGAPMSIEFNNNITFNMIYDYRDFQEVFGQGSEGQRPMSVDVAKATETLSWGERMDGGKAVNFLGKEYAYSPTDNWDEFYRTGINESASLSLTGAGDKISYRFGLSNVYERGALPNAYISQQGINMNTTYDILKNLHLTVNANYVFEKNKGRTNLSDGNGNTNASLLYRANSFDVRWMERETPGSDIGATADGKEMLGGSDPYFNNPYWLQHRKVNTSDKNRLTGAMTLKYDITDWLYAQGAITRDGYNFDWRNVQPYGAGADPQGYLEEYVKHFSEMNINYLIGFNKQFQDWTIGASFGGNRQRSIVKQWGTDGNIKGFLVPGFESANNISNRVYKKDYTEYRVNSIYGTADIGWKNQVFLNVTGRNDWFSTLSPDNNHYFYPSVSLSWVFTDTFQMPDWFTFGKVRASYASASNGTSAYQNYLTYKLQNYKINGQSIATVNNGTLPNGNLKPVRISEWEGGLNLAFFNNRLTLDAAYYVKKTKDDIAMVSTSGASGFRSAIQNIGEIQNTGIEVMISALPVSTKNFNWKTTFNISHNDSEVKFLGEGVESLSIDGAESRRGQVTVENIIGKPYGELVGYKYKRDGAGNIVHSNGVPIRADEKTSLGSGVYKLTGGWRNELSYKNWSMAFLIDFKFGAKLFSGTNYFLYNAGLHKNTLAGRGTDGKGTLVGEGVMLDASGNYVKNDVPVSAQAYWQGVVNNDIAEEFIYNASFIKLRELSLGYTLPKSVLNGSFIKDATISIVGRNLWTIKKHTDNIDPESAYNNTNGQGLELNGYPATRNIGLNVNVKF